MSDEAPYTLTEKQVRWLRSLIREDLRKQDRGAANLKRKFGRDYDSSAKDRKKEMAEDAYRRLGGDPNRIDR